ncbi:MAG: MoxR family ATPase [Gammaproteobacteria bacterium]|jgi:MoxR-like ATPase
MAQRPTGNPSPDLRIQRVLQGLDRIILGKHHQLKLAFACLLGRGHLLIEDLPGVGKTTLAHAFAKVLGLQFQRIQFTSDLLPADILGVSVFDRETGGFQFHPGPIFAQLILADEVNRATPKTQSALLEAMEEHQVTVEGMTRPLPEPFFVIATQNPRHQIGTFPLPESQLDRFLMRIELGFPNQHAERALLMGQDRRDLIESMEPAMSEADLLGLQARVRQIHVAEPIVDYVQALLAASREPGRYREGLSPRAGLALLHGAQAWALIEGRDFVQPEDVQVILPAVAGHRLRPVDDSQPVEALTRHLIESVAVA